MIIRKSTSVLRPFFAIMTSLFFLLLSQYSAATPIDKPSQVSPIENTLTNTNKIFAKMPSAVSNNAVTQVAINNKSYLISFSGLGESKTYQAVHNRTYVYDVNSNQWLQKSSVPITKPIHGLTGRLASVATSINELAYVFGGYTVAKDHSETSIADVYSYHVIKDVYSQLAPMPIPVDDSVALPYKNRYIYLVSGWHNDGNVNLVQLYDTKTDSWQQASPFPGKAVFGHAAGIVDNILLVCDGVGVDVHIQKRRSYRAEAACYRGEINENKANKITWNKIEHPTGNARYRMAAKGFNYANNRNNKETSEIIFLGGSENPYNYNGIGYNKIPSKPSNILWRYNIDDSTWQLSTIQIATMDHRGLLTLGNALITIGGMGKNQKILDTINFAGYIQQPEK